MIQAIPAANNPRTTNDAPLISGPLAIEAVTPNRSDPWTDNLFEVVFRVGSTRCQRPIRAEELRSFRSFQLSTIRTINAIPRLETRRGEKIDAAFAELIDAAIRRGATQ